MSLRKWQAEALEKYRKQNPRDFTVTATPGAGKTTFALELAAKLKGAKQIDKVIVICPTDHLRKQWSDAAIEKGMILDPTLTNSRGLIPEGFDGYVATYAQVGMDPARHRARVAAAKNRAMIIFDEIHHAGDGLSWGEGLRIAFSEASRRLSLTGTPFRTGNEIIPFVKYEADTDGANVSCTDYSYGYKEALEDDVVRPVSFATYSGEAEWVNSAGKQLKATLGTPMTKAQELEAWRTVLNPRGVWIREVIKSAHQKLTHLRESTMPNAGGMILAGDQKAARAYAKLLEEISGVVPTLILSDDRKASQKIAEFSNSTSSGDQWIVAVRMVSEGVDVPRLAVGIWATSYRTPLFFAQAVGRFIRKKGPGESATVFVPAVKPLLYLASTMEEQRNHAVIVGDPEEPEVEDLEKAEREPSIGEFEALESSAEFEHILFNGKAYTLADLSADDLEYLGLFTGVLSPEELGKMLEKRPREAEVVEEVEEKPEEANIFEEMETLRKQINKAVSRVALAQGIPYAKIHKQIRTAVPGPAQPDASVELLRRRHAWVTENL